jgi:hypothetical protein
MQTKREFVMRTVAGDNLLVPVGKTAIDMNGLVVLNEVAARIWQLLPQAEDETALVDALLSEYDVERAVLEKDVAEFMEQLRGMGIL